MVALLRCPRYYYMFLAKFPTQPITVTQSICPVGSSLLQSTLKYSSWRVTALFLVIPHIAPSHTRPVHDLHNRSWCLHVGYFVGFELGELSQVSKERHHQFFLLVFLLRKKRERNRKNVCIFLLKKVGSIVTKHFCSAYTKLLTTG